MLRLRVLTTWAFGKTPVARGLLAASLATVCFAGCAPAVDADDASRDEDLTSHSIQGANGAFSDDGRFVFVIRVAWLL